MEKADAAWVASVRERHRHERIALDREYQRARHRKWPDYHNYLNEIKTWLFETLDRTKCGQYCEVILRKDCVAARYMDSLCCLRLQPVSLTCAPPPVCHWDAFLCHKYTVPKFEHRGIIKQAADDLCAWASEIGLECDMQTGESNMARAPFSSNDAKLEAWGYVAKDYPVIIVGFRFSREEDKLSF